MSDDFELVYRCLIRGAKAALTGKGCGIYYQHVSEHRLTGLGSRARWRSDLEARLLVVNYAKSSGLFDNDVRNAIIAETEPWMRAFARWADDEVYSEAKEFFYGLGGKKLSGSWIHQLGCLLIGLRRKERLSLKILQIKELLESQNRF